MKSAAIMVTFSVLVLAAGLYAFTAAPAGANPATALIMSGVAAGLMLMAAVFASMIGRNRAIGTAGVIAGIALSLLFAASNGWIASRRWAQVNNAPAANAAFAEAVKADASLNQDDRKRAFFRERNASPHDVTYLRNTLVFITALSALTGAALLVTFPTGRNKRAA